MQYPPPHPVAELSSESGEILDSITFISMALHKRSISCTTPVIVECTHSFWWPSFPWSPEPTFLVHLRTRNRTVESFEDPRNR